MLLYLLMVSYSSTLFNRHKIYIKHNCFQCCQCGYIFYNILYLYIFIFHQLHSYNTFDTIFTNTCNYIHTHARAHPRTHTLHTLQSKNNTPRLKLNCEVSCSMRVSSVSWLQSTQHRAWMQALNWPGLLSSASISSQCEVTGPLKSILCFRSRCLRRFVFCVRLIIWSDASQDVSSKALHRETRSLCSTVDLLR